MKKQLKKEKTEKLVKPKVNKVFDIEEWSEEINKENKRLEEWIIDNIGSRCEDYEKDCFICQRWKLLDKLKLRID
jgi:hypothetical protein